MQSIYILIVADSSVSLASRFFQVWVSCSAQGERDCRFLERWAAETKSYWSVRNNDAADFLQRVATSLHTKVFLLPFRKITARCLVRFIKANHDVPATCEVTRAACHLRRILYPADYYLNKINVLRQAEVKQRNKPKSLDSRHMDDIHLMVPTHLTYSVL